MPTHPGQDKTVERLLTAIDRGEFVIPFFQRGFEWKPNMVKDLLISIVSGYFTGLLLFWELDGEDGRNKQWEPVRGAKIGEKVYYAILDGQQRLSSLFFALYNPNQPFPDRQSYYLFYLSIEKYLASDYEECVFYNYQRTYTKLSDLKNEKRRWIDELVLPIALLSDDDFAKREHAEWMDEYAEVLANKRFGPIGTSVSKQRYDFVLKTRSELNRLVQAVLGYDFATHVLTKDKDIKEVCLVFAKLNQKGLKLSTFDLMNAFLFPHGVMLRKSYEAMEGKLTFVPDMEELLLKTMALRTQSYSSPKYIFGLVPGFKTAQVVDGARTEVVIVADGSAFSKLWESACKYNEKARQKIMNVGDKDFGAIKVDFIPNTTTIPVIAATYWLKDGSSTIGDGEFDNILSRWYWSAVFSQEYSGSSDSVISQDFRAFKKWIDGSVSPENLESARLLRIVDNLNLKGEKKGTSVYNAIISLIALRRARDFYLLRSPGSGDYVEATVDDHHIFPSKVVGLDPAKCKTFAECKDSIVNRTLLLDETNIKIGNRKPSDYLQEVRDKLAGSSNSLEELMESHLISKEALECLWKDDFDGFILCRERTMLEEVRRRLNLPP